MTNKAFHRYGPIILFAAGLATLLIIGAVFHAIVATVFLIHLVTSHVLRARKAARS